MAQVLDRQSVARNVVQDIPTRFWDDFHWLQAHINELAAQFPNCWVIIYNEKVVGADRDLGKAEDAAEKIIGKLDIAYPVTDYVEVGVHVYQSRSAL
jgi:hypothetical protein